jgi:hypothetical protein
MTTRITLISTAAVALAALSLAGIGGSTAEGSDQAKLAGDAGPGPYVQGCVDCHSEDGPENIGALLADFGHRNVDEQTSKVPGDCAECHSEAGGDTPLSEFAHFVHFDKPATNDFVQKYGGDCLHCHTLDAKTGVITVKSGPKNW